MTNTEETTVQEVKIKEPNVEEPKVEGDYKYTLPNFLRSFGPLILISYVIFLRVIPPEIGFTLGSLQAISVGLYSYFFHIFVHNMPDHPLNYHLYSHHNKKFNLSRNVELTLEFINDLSYFVFFMIIQNILGLKLVSNKILMFIGMWYSCTHIIDMSIIPCLEHRNHHIDHNYNYGPSFLDFIFGTLKVEEGYTADSQALCGVILCILYDLLDKYKFI